MKCKSVVGINQLVGLINNSDKRLIYCEKIQLMKRSDDTIFMRKSNSNRNNLFILSLVLSDK